LLSLGAPVDVFFAFEETGGGGQDCTTAGNNDIWGCGSGTTLFNNNCQGNGDFVKLITAGNTIPGWSFNSNTDEFSTAVNANSANGGVMCCRSSINMAPFNVNNNNNNNNIKVNNGLFSSIIILAIGITLVIISYIIYKKCKNKIKKNSMKNDEKTMVTIVTQQSIEPSNSNQEIITPLPQNTTSMQETAR